MLVRCADSVVGREKRCVGVGGDVGVSVVFTYSAGRLHTHESTYHLYI